MVDILITIGIVIGALMIIGVVLNVVVYIAAMIINIRTMRRHKRHQEKILKKWGK